MEKKLKIIFDFLTTHEGFYMDQYNSNEKLKWIGLKKFPQGLYAVIVTDDMNSVRDEEEARKYLDGKMENYSLHIIILSEKGYTNIDNISCKKIVIDNEKNKLIYSSPELISLADVLVEILNPRRKKEEYRGSMLTISLIVVNVIIFLISAGISGSIIDIDSRTLLNMGAKYNPYINNGEIWRLFTAAFLHGGIMHLACNMYSLYIVGSQIERIYGRTKYMIIYVLSALGSSGLSYALAPKSLSVGASGAIFGLLGALLVFAIKEKNRLSKGAIGNLFAVIGLNLYIGLTIPNIDNYGHIGGLAVGVIVSIILSII